MGGGIKNGIKIGSKGKLVLLDGTSSAGKTSVSSRLVVKYSKQFEPIGIDDFITEVFELRKKHQLSERHFVSLCNNNVASMYALIAQKVLAGHNIICDTTLTCLGDAQSTDRWFKYIKDLTGFLVLVYCPIHLLAERITLRNEQAVACGTPENSRLITVALHQFGVMFKPQENIGEPIIDTVHRHQIEYACQLARPSFKTNIYAFNEFQSTLLAQFGLIDKKFVYITTRLVYDLIVDTHKHSADECVQQVTSHLDFDFNKSIALTVNCRNLQLLGKFMLNWAHLLCL